MKRDKIKANIAKSFKTFITFRQRFNNFSIYILHLQKNFYVVTFCKIILWVKMCIFNTERYYYTIIIILRIIIVLFAYDLSVIGYLDSIF